MTRGWAGRTLEREADFPGLDVSSYAVRMNEPGFPRLVSHGWVETAAQAMKCGEEASGGQ